MTNYNEQTVRMNIELIEHISIQDACRICDIQVDFVSALAIEGVFEFHTNDPDQWHLNAGQFALLRRATRLHQDLQINPPGIAMVLELLDT